MVYICIVGKDHKWALEAEARLPQEEKLQTNEPSMYAVRLVALLFVTMLVLIKPHTLRSYFTSCVEIRIIDFLFSKYRQRENVVYAQN